MNEDHQIDIFEMLDSDQPGQLCRKSATPVVMEWNNEWQVNCPSCNRKVSIRTDGRYPRHYVPG
jgi:hypothetical protein